MNNLILQKHIDTVLDREIELQEIARCVGNLKITRLVVVMDLWGVSRGILELELSQDYQSIPT